MFMSGGKKTLLFPSPLNRIVKYFVGNSYSSRQSLYTNGTFQMMRVNMVHGSGLRDVQTCEGLRNKDEIVQGDVVTGTVHDRVTLNFISFKPNEDWVISVYLTDDLGPFCAGIRWSCR